MADFLFHPVVSNVKILLVEVVHHSALRVPHSDRRVHQNTSQCNGGGSRRFLDGYARLRLDRSFRRFLGSGQKATQQQECSRDHIRIDRMFHSPPYIPWCICFDAICPKDVAEAPAPAYNRSSLLGDSSCLSTLRSASSR